jgi:hypothetical protein
VSDTHPPGLWFTPGDAVLARLGNLILLSNVTEDGFLDNLLDGLTREFACLDEDAIKNDGAWRTSHGGEPDPAFVAIGLASAGLTATVSGTAWAEITTAHGPQRLEAGQPSLLLRCVLGSPAIAVHGGVAADRGHTSIDRFSRLDGGIVRAGGFRYYPGHADVSAGAAGGPGTLSAVAESGAATASANGEAVRAAEPFDAVPLAGGAQDEVEARLVLPLASAIPVRQGGADAPIVSGVYCKNGHFDDPQARFCAVCGVSINQLQVAPRPGRRPPLGVLIQDNGEVFQLDSDYVIGRDPTLDASAAAGQADPLRTADDAGTASWADARIELDGWRVLVTDLGSANGSRIRLPGQAADRALTPRTPAQLLPGSLVDLGGSRFRYESHRGR